jgi:hypothetical protein
MNVAEHSPTLVESRAAVGNSDVADPPPMILMSGCTPGPPGPAGSFAELTPEGETRRRSAQREARPAVRICSIIPRS